MERPSHIIFDTQSHYVSRRLPLIGLAFSLQFAVFWLFTHGLVGQWKNVIPGVIEVIPIHEKDMPRLPPPEPDITKRIEVPYAPLPAVDYSSGQQGRSTITATTTPATNPQSTVPAADIAPVGIVKTHTVPPYPPIARRIGAEGKVSLRLTVSAEGRVSQADIVTSSGRDDLDQTAQQWIVAHWIYKPALDHGIPAVSHTLATVTFSLINER
jgi:protein TonB